MKAGCMDTIHQKTFSLCTRASSLRADASCALTESAQLNIGSVRVRVLEIAQASNISIAEQQRSAIKIVWFNAVAPHVDTKKSALSTNRYPVAI